MCFAKVHDGKKEIYIQWSIRFTGPFRNISFSARLTKCVNKFIDGFCRWAKIDKFICWVPEFQWIGNDVLPFPKEKKYVFLFLFWWNVNYILSVLGFAMILLDRIDHELREHFYFESIKKINKNANEAWRHHHHLWMSSDSLLVLVRIFWIWSEFAGVNGMEASGKKLMRRKKQSRFAMQCSNWTRNSIFIIRSSMSVKLEIPVRREPSLLRSKI